MGTAPVGRAPGGSAAVAVDARAPGLLVAVAVLFFVASVTLVDPTRFPVFDEAIYLSEVQRGAEGLSFSAHRARGITWIVAPIAGVGGSLTTVRLWLALVCGAALWWAYRPWLRIIGVCAPVAAAVCASTWAVLLYATDVSPNLLAAFAAVAATGYAFAPPGTGGRPLAGVAIAMAVLALVRPTETIWLGMVFALVLPRWGRGVTALVSAGAGTVTGWIPWLVEAYLRFDGPLQRYREMSDATTTPVFGSRRILRYLRAADGPIYRGVWDTDWVPDAPVSPVVVVWAVVIVVLALVGAMRPRSPRAAPAVRTAAVAGVVLMSVYVVLNQSIHVRFLLPAWALACVPIAEAVVGLTGRVRTRGVGVAVGLVGVAWLVAQATTVLAVGGRLASAEQEEGRLAQAVQPAVERPCFLLSEGGYAQLGFLVGCRSDWYRPDEDPPFRVPPSERADGGRQVYVLARTVHPTFADWPSDPVPAHPAWRLYRMPE